MITKLLLRPYPNSSSYLLVIGGLPDSYVDHCLRFTTSHGLEAKLSKIHGVKLLGLSLVVSPSSLSPPALAITFTTVYLSDHAVKLIMAAVVASIDPPQLPHPGYRIPRYPEPVRPGSPLLL